MQTRITATTRYRRSTAPHSTVLHVFDTLLNSKPSFAIFPSSLQDADPEFVEITPLTHVPMSSVEQFVGRLQLHLIKETWSFRDEGGLGAFAHVFLAGTLRVNRRLL